MDKSLKKLHLNSQDILNKKFKKNVKGYDADEVDSYLDFVIEDYNSFIELYEELITKLNDCKRENESLRATVRQKDDELRLEKSKIASTEQLSAPMSVNLELLQKCSRYEKMLHTLGVDPSKIK